MQSKREYTRDDGSGKGYKGTKGQKKQIFYRFIRLIKIKNLFLFLLLSLCILFLTANYVYYPVMIQFPCLLLMQTRELYNVIQSEAAGTSTILDGAVRITVEIEALLILVHGAEAHAHRRETAVVIEVLHRHLAGEV